MPRISIFKKSTVAAASQEPRAIELRGTNVTIASSSGVSSADNVHTPLFSRKDAALAAFQGVTLGAQAILQAANEPIASSVLASVSQIIKLAGVSYPLCYSNTGTDVFC